MKIHEYQAKALFAQYGIPIPKGQAVFSPSEALEAAQALGSPGKAYRASTTVTLSLPPDSRARSTSARQAFSEPSI